MGKGVVSFENHKVRYGYLCERNQIGHPPHLRMASPCDFARVELHRPRFVRTQSLYVHEEVHRLDTSRWTRHLLRTAGGIHRLRIYKERW